MSIRRVMHDVKRRVAGYRRRARNLPLPKTALRNELADRYLRGCGIEIGALHHPLPVPETARVRYVDRFSHEALVRLYPTIDEESIVAPAIIDDGFELASIPEASEDFVIANHVIEHAPNPLGTLERWCRVLRPGGVLFATAPLAEKCFDHSRPITPLVHLVEDRRLSLLDDRAALSQRDRQHLVEWFQISIPNMARQQDDLPFYAPDDDETDRIIGERDPSQADIHFHTFSIESYLEMMGYLCAHLAPTMRVVDYAMPGGFECTVVLQKSAAEERRRGWRRLLSGS